MGGAGKGGSHTNAISLYDTADDFTFIGGPGGTAEREREREREREGGGRKKWRENGRRVKKGGGAK